MYHPACPDNDRCLTTRWQLLGQLREFAGQRASARSCSGFDSDPLESGETGAFGDNCGFTPRSCPKYKFIHTYVQYTYDITYVLYYYCICVYIYTHTHTCMYVLGDHLWLGLISLDGDHPSYDGNQGVAIFEATNSFSKTFSRGWHLTRSHCIISRSEWGCSWTRATRHTSCPNFEGMAAQTWVTNGPRVLLCCCNKAFSFQVPEFWGIPN